MQDWMRLSIFGAVVAVITLLIAPPERTAAEAGRQAAAPAQETQTDITGTYGGAITSDSPGGLPDHGTIVIRRDQDNLVVTGGPDSGTQYPAANVVRTADGLTFEIAIEGERPVVLRFDLKISAREMSGAVSGLRDGLERRGRLAFVRQ